MGDIMSSLCKKWTSHDLLYTLEILKNKGEFQVSQFTVFFFKAKKRANKIMRYRGHILLKTKTKCATVLPR